MIRRITGQRLGEFFAAHVAGPLGAGGGGTIAAALAERVAEIVKR